MAAKIDMHVDVCWRDVGGDVARCGAGMSYSVPHRPQGKPDILYLA